MEEFRKNLKILAAAVLLFGAFAALCLASEHPKRAGNGMPLYDSTKEAVLDYCKGRYGTDVKIVEWEYVPQRSDSIPFGKYYNGECNVTVKDKNGQFTVHVYNWSGDYITDDRGE